MADPTKRTPTLEEYGTSVKVSAVDIRTVAIALPKQVFAIFSYRSKRFANLPCVFLPKSFSFSQPLVESPAFH